MPDRLLPIPPGVIDEAVLAALDEDGAYNDVTTNAVVAADSWGQGVIRAKEAGVIAGLAVAAAAMTALDESVTFDTLIEDGERVAAGTELAEVEGRMAPILSCERVALNFLQRMSGVATLTRDFVDAARGTKAIILDTRKTTPGLRQFDRYAVRAGGGRNHRFNLADGVLIKDNHIAAARHQGAPDLAHVIADARKAAPHTARIEIEVTTIDEVKEALEGGADVILLDNMSVEEIRRAVEIIGGGALVEVSGGVTLANAHEIAEAGVDYISVGALTHSAPALDISLDVQGV
jgi:nicotinate-nucleotide pyrophosphorylase (carboxylating)